MARIVLKFGGTSLASPLVIKQAAKHIVREWNDGHEIAVIVSAMAGETERLIALVEQTANLYDAREYDTVVSCGEQVSAGLMSLVLQEQGIPARSWTGWQLPILTNARHCNALVESIQCQGILDRFSDRTVAVVTGFQGCSDQNRITTLGRSGSDTSAVLLAAALGASRCDIYTDVLGVYTCDPNINPKARIIDRITYEEMLELSSLGAKVLHTRSVAAALRFGISVRVRSTFSQHHGTLIDHENKDDMEAKNVTGIAHSFDEAVISLSGLKDQPGVSAQIFSALMDQSIFVDMIIQSTKHEVSKYPETDMTFTVSRKDLARAVSILEKNQKDIQFRTIFTRQDVAKISAVGVGMRLSTGIAAQMFKVLAERHINIMAISTSEIKISVLIDEAYVELATRALHHAFNLDSDETIEQKNSLDTNSPDTNSLDTNSLGTN